MSTKFPVLASYAYIRNNLDYWRQMLDESPDVDWLVDSGAFTVYNTGGRGIKMEEYFAFIDEFKDKVFGYFALDVVADTKATNANLTTMIKHGYKPIPIHIAGDNEKRMDELFEMSDFVALSGLNRSRELLLSKKWVFNYLTTKMRWAKGRRVHWLGATRANWMQAHRPYSADSSTWINGGKYGQLAVYLGGGRWSNSYGYKQVTKMLQDKVALRILRRHHPNIETILKDPASWVGKDGQHTIGNLTTESWIRFSRDIERHFGTRVFLSTSPSPHGYEPIRRAIDLNKRN